MRVPLGRAAERLRCKPGTIKQMGTSAPADAAAVARALYTARWPGRRCSPAVWTEAIPILGCRDGVRAAPLDDPACQPGAGAATEEMSAVTDAASGARAAPQEQQKKTASGEFSITG